MNSRWTWMLALICLVAFVMAGPVLADEVEDELEDLNDRVEALELKTAKNKISFFGDLRVKYDYLEYEYAAYNQYLGGDPMNPANYMPVSPYSLHNGENYSLRLRLKLDAKVSRTLHFTGRLTSHFNYGGSPYPIFNGFPNTVYYGFNSTSVPTSNIVRVERAAFTWDPIDGKLFFTVGRQAATNGPARELREDRVRQGTPGALMIDAEIDGIMVGTKFASYSKAPDGTILRICYGTGYESSFGSGGRVGSAQTAVMTPTGLQSAELSGLKDMKVAGACLEGPLSFVPGKTLMTLGFFRALDMVDISTGSTRNFPDPSNGDPQLVTATANLGDMDLYGLSFQHDYNDFVWFVSLAGNKSHPVAGAASQYGFGSLLGNPTSSETGFAYFLGGRAPIKPLRGKLGVEYNHGNAHWFSFTQGSDDFAMSKLATRGSVFEAYYIQRLEKKLNLRFGAQFFKYDFAFSGWHIAPGPIEEMFDLSKNPSLAYAFPDKATNFYVVADLSF